MLKVYIRTFGCQMNEYDTELIRSILQKEGFAFTDNALDADIILLNTCSVREKANRTVMEMVHRIRHDRQGRSAVYGILGCMATHLGEELINDPHLNLDLIAGPDSYKKLPKLIAQAQAEKTFDLELSDMETYDDIYPNRESSVNPSTSLRVNAWIAIMRGCNNFCSYCVVPYARGRERSRSMKGILEETKQLVQDGFAQVTLLGQNVNSYGHNGVHFPELLAKVAAVDGIERVWFTSPHPKDVADELIDVISENPKVCKHIHLPLQAGNSEILKKMNRPYTKERYLALVEKLRARCPQIAVTTDIIVGFPGETDAQFQDTVDVFNTVGYDAAFIFKYSPRKGTEAALKLSDDVPEKAKTERIVLLNELQQKYALQRNEALVGTTQEILIEAIRDDGEMEGRTMQNKRTILKSAPAPQCPSAPDNQGLLGKRGTGGTCLTDRQGHLINCQITFATPHLLKAEPASA